MPPQQKALDKLEYEKALAALDRFLASGETSTDFPDLPEAPELPREGEQTLAMVYSRVRTKGTDRTP